MLITFVFPGLLIYVPLISAVFWEAVSGLKACLLLSLEADHSAQDNVVSTEIFL